MEQKIVCLSRVWDSTQKAEKNGYVPLVQQTISVESKQEKIFVRFPKDPDRDYSVSNAEIKIRKALYNKDCYGADYNKPFYKLITSADFYFSDINLAIFVDGEQVHKDKEFSDKDKRDLVAKLHGCTIRSYSYKDPITKKRLAEIVDLIVDDVEGLRKMQK